MKKFLFALFAVACLSFISNDLFAQCSICTKTAMQLGAKPAQGLNSGILYLIAVPYLTIGVICYKWWKSKKEKEA